MSEKDQFSILHEFPDSSTERLWREFLADADSARHYTSPEFFREPFLRGKMPFAVLARSEDRIDGVLTGIHEGKHTVSGLSVRPQVAFRKGVDLARVADQSVAGVLAEGAKSELITVFAWSPLPEFVSNKFQVKQEEGVVILDLSLSLDALRRNMAGTRKNAINFAVKHGVQVHQAEKEEEFKEYYTIYEKWCVKKGTPPTAYKIWRKAFELRSNRRLFLATAEGKIIAGSVFRFTPGGIVEYAANSSLDEFLHLKPNDLLNWRAIEWAHAEGFQKYDLGGSHLFLRKSGGTLVSTYRHRLDRSFLRRHDLREITEAHARRLIRKVVRPKRKDAPKTLRTTA
jgi:Acetyltransferase (GNAT) domain